MAHRHPRGCAHWRASHVTPRLPRRPLVTVFLVTVILAVAIAAAALRDETSSVRQARAPDGTPREISPTTFATPSTANRIPQPTLHRANRDSATRAASHAAASRTSVVSSATRHTQPEVRKPLAGKTIVIDPGHQLGNSRHLGEVDRLVDAGGFEKPCNSTGTSTDAGFPEATFTWDVAVDLRSLLRSEGAKVVMTRSSNSYEAWGPCVDARGRLGNQVHADAAISIHGDGADAAYRGFFVIRPRLLPGWTDDIFESSHRLAGLVHAALVHAGAAVANDYGGTGYSTRTDLGTLNWSNVPIVMVELGNMRNAIDAAHMTSEAYRNDVYARGLARGVTAFLAAR